MLWGSLWEGPRTVLQANDLNKSHELVVFGGTYSNNGDISFNNGKNDYWLFKINEFSQIQWEYTFGGSEDEYTSQMLRTPDGGFLMFGETYSQDGDVGCNHSSNGDWWLVKTDSLGNKEWSRCLGGTHKEYAMQIKYAHEDGYVLVGTTGSSDGDIAYNNGMNDVWVVKIDWDGNILWERTFGGTSNDTGYTVNLTSDGGYIIGGSVSLWNGEFSCRDDLPFQQSGAWLLKLDSLGYLEWWKCYGGSNSASIIDVLHTANRGYVFLGYTNSNDGDISCYHGIPGNGNWSDMWVVKVDSIGQIEWQRCLGGTGYDVPRIIRPLDDGGFIVGGNSTSQDGDALCNESLQGGHTVILHRLSPQGDLLWTKCLGSPVDNSLFAMHVFSPTHYLLGATARSNGIDVNCTLKGETDIWLVEIMDTTVSILEHRPAVSGAGFLLYPNPATTETWLQLPEGTNITPLQVQLISHSGRLVYHAVAQGRFHKLTTAHLPAGLYLVRLWDGEKWLVHKLVKEH
ncbi:MAG: hypothetical protein CVT92_12070 [Bacteroidetes bacterium HGW-Bacteroidetes-1]|jgi:hypothetical protein|nr:MAG: hypothetical protein CVT92_12070 [Bacteroidetes bacterium HGW-Bacteroidetes-1]